MRRLVHLAIASLALTGLCANAAVAASAHRTLDEAIETYRADLAATCERHGRFEELPGFIQRLDINGDGV